MVHEWSLMSNVLHNNDTNPSDALGNRIPQLVGFQVTHGCKQCHLAHEWRCGRWYTFLLLGQRQWLPLHQGWHIRAHLLLTDVHINQAFLVKPLHLLLCLTSTLRFSSYLSLLWELLLSQLFFLSFLDLGEGALGFTHLGSSLSGSAFLVLLRLLLSEQLLIFQLLLHFTDPIRDIMLFANYHLLVQANYLGFVNALRVIGSIAPTALIKSHCVPGYPAVGAVVEWTTEFSVAVGVVVFEEFVALDALRVKEFIAVGSRAFQQLTLLQK